MAGQQAPDHPWSPEVCATIRQMAYDAGPESYLRQQNAMRNRIDSRPGLGAIACPTTIIHGREDPTWPLENGEELADLIPGAQLSVIDQCGHFATLDQPEATTACIRAWLTA